MTITQRIIASVRKMLLSEKKPVSESSYSSTDKRNSKLNWIFLMITSKGMCFEWRTRDIFIYLYSYYI